VSGRALISVGAGIPVCAATLAMVRALRVCLTSASFRKRTRVLGASPHSCASRVGESSVAVRTSPNHRRTAACSASNGAWFLAGTAVAYLRVSSFNVRPQNSPLTPRNNARYHRTMDGGSCCSLLVANGIYKCQLLDPLALCARAKAVGLTISEWGRRAGTAPSAIYRWRGNQLSPRLDTILRLNEVLCTAEFEAKQRNGKGAE
jgi:hypothetical protein